MFPMRLVGQPVLLFSMLLSLSLMGLRSRRSKKFFDSYSLLYPNTVVCILYFKYILDFVGNNTLGLKLLLYNYIPGGNVNFVKVLSIISVCHIRYYLLLSIYTKPHWHIMFRVSSLAILVTDVMWVLSQAGPAGKEDRTLGRFLL